MLNRRTILSGKPSTQTTPVELIEACPSDTKDGLTQDLVDTQIKEALGIGWP